MKTTGIVRKVDELGRIVIPKETREQLYIDIKDPLEIFLDADQAALILKKYSPGCIFCGDMDEIHNFKEKVICNQCLNEIAKEFK